MKLNMRGDKMLKRSKTRHETCDDCAAKLEACPLRGLLWVLVTQKQVILILVLHQGCKMFWPGAWAVQGAHSIGQTRKGVGGCQCPSTASHFPSPPHQSSPRSLGHQIYVSERLVTDFVSSSNALHVGHTSGKLPTLRLLVPHRR